MNAYELADENDKYWEIWQQNIPMFKDVSTMLRQQADRIAELEKEFHNQYWIGHEDGKHCGVLESSIQTHPAKQSNLAKVVKNHIEDLWRCVKTFRSYEMDNTADEMEVAIKELENAIQSHPVKQLSDEEIDKLAEYHGIDSLYETGRIDFARAIIKEITE